MGVQLELTNKKKMKDKFVLIVSLIVTSVTTRISVNNVGLPL